MLVLIAGCVTRQVQAFPSELRAHAGELQTRGKATGHHRRDPASGRRRAAHSPGHECDQRDVAIGAGLTVVGVGLLLRAFMAH